MKRREKAIEMTAVVVVLLREFAEMWSGLNPWPNDLGFGWVLKNLTMGVKTICQATLGESAAGFPQHLSSHIPTQHSSYCPRLVLFAFVWTYPLWTKKKKKDRKEGENVIIGLSFVFITGHRWHWFCQESEGSILLGTSRGTVIDSDGDS